MGGQNSALLAESYCDWWSLAGVDSLVGDEPAGWLTLPAANDPKPKIVADDEPLPLPTALQRQAPAEASTSRGPVTFPDEWDAFQAWLAEHPDVPGSQWDARRVLPNGAPGAPLMILTAWPEIDDQRDAAERKSPRLKSSH